MARKTQAELQEEIEVAKQQVEVGATYTHYKSGDAYKAVDLAIDEATDDVVVVYQALYGDGLRFTRALSSWLETPEKDGKQVPRFAKAG